MHVQLRSEEHTSELQSHDNLVCRLLLEKKKGRGKGTSAADGHRCVGPDERSERAHRQARPQHAREALTRPPVMLSAGRRAFFLKEGAPPETSPLPLHELLPI